MSAPRRKYGEGTVRPHGRGWQIRWYENGQPKVEQVKGSEREATKRLQQRQAAVTEGRPTGHEGRKLTLADVKALLHDDQVKLERRAIARAERAFDAVIVAFGERCRVAELSAQRLARYVTTRLEAGYARATVQKELAAVKRGLNVAVEAGLLPYRVAFPKLGKIDNARCEFVSEVEWMLARPELPAWWQDMGDMAIEMGWRCRSEFLGLEKLHGQPREPLRWSDVDWEKGVVSRDGTATKNASARAYPFGAAPLVKAALERRRAYTDDVEQRTGQPVPYVFHVEGERISDHRLYVPWRAACKKVGVLGADGRPKRPHDFRRSAVRALEVGGVPRSIAKRLVGHKTDAMYARYSITTEADLRNAVEQQHAPRPVKVETPITVEAAIAALLAAGVTSIDGELVTAHARRQGGAA